MIILVINTCVVSLKVIMLCNKYLGGFFEGDYALSGFFEVSGTKVYSFFCCETQSYMFQKLLMTNLIYS